MNIEVGKIKNSKIVARRQGIKGSLSDLGKA